jgi:hypothetical protein
VRVGKKILLDASRSRDAGIVGVERRGLWAFYYVHPESLEELRSWLS